MRKKFSLIIPVYRNEGSIDQLLGELDNISKAVNKKSSCDLEVVFVIDGSPDNSFAVLQSKLPSQKFDSQLVSLSRNFGSFTAIRKGLEIGTGDFFGVMAADCQEPPQLMIDACAQLNDDETDVVVGVRERRDDPFFYKMFSQVFWRMYRKSVVKDIPRGGVDIFACSSKVRDALLSLPETHSSLVAQLFWVGFRRSEIKYERLPRLDGLKSGWTFKKRISYMSDSIFAFTDIPVRFLLMLGILGTIFSFGASLVVLASWAFGWIDIPGYTPIILSQLMLFTVTLLGFGIVGSYTWRAFENTKSRPLGIVSIQEVFENANNS